MSNEQSLLAIAQSYHPLVQSRTKSPTSICVYGIDLNDINDIVLLSGGDSNKKVESIYDIIEDPALPGYLSLYDVLVFVSLGWALPKSSPDFGGPNPISESSDRVRVQMTNYLFSSDKQMISSLTLNPDTKDAEVQWAGSDTSGTFQEAVMSLYDV